MERSTGGIPSPMSLLPTPPESSSPPSQGGSGGMLRTGGLSITIPLILALIIGIQLGGIPWRYRRQLWLLQGFALGAVAGYVAGRFSRSSQRDEGRNG